jgi:hypothetical protein
VRFAEFLADFIFEAAALLLNRQVSRQPTEPSGFEHSA